MLTLSGFSRYVAPAIWIVLLACSSAQASVRLELNGDWKFRTDPSEQGVELGWTRQLPDSFETVDVPHTWNIGRHEDYEGVAWYFKTFAVNDALLGKHAEVHFGATFSRAQVWLNGTRIGGREGGYTEYYFDATEHLKPLNFLAVAVDNRPGAQTIPGWAMRGRGADDTGVIWYDWWHYGGIVRDVWLTFDESVVIRRQQIRTTLSGNGASAEDRIFLENYSDEPIAVSLVVEAFAPGARRPVATGERKLELPPGASAQTMILRLDSPKLWDFDHPNLYRLETRLTDPASALIDSRSDEFGVRKIEIRDRRLFLNGERVRLSGITRHEDSPQEGLAETRGTILYDYDDLKALHVTLTRPVHYPQHPAILEYCDRNGILLIPEIPMWQFSERQMSDPKVIDLAKRMMREMIEQDYNHPSIMAWSLCNESSPSTPGGVEYLKTMCKWVKALDSDRFVSFADDGIGRQETASPAVEYADFIMMNQYFGSWHGPAAALTTALDRMGQLYPDKMVIISEFGFPGVFAVDSKSADKARVRVLEEQMKIFGKYDWIGGAIFWCYQDYKSHRNVWPGLTRGWVDHGLVDENRQRRPSYQVWRRLNSPVQLDASWKASDQFPYPPIGFAATVSGRSEDEIPSYRLSDYRLTWEARGSEGQMLGSGEEKLPEIGKPVAIDGAWIALDPRSVTLAVTVYRPTGFVAFEKKFEWRGPVVGGETVGDMEKKGASPPEPEQ